MMFVSLAFFMQFTLPYVCLNILTKNKFQIKINLFTENKGLRKNNSVDNPLHRSTDFEPWYRLRSDFILSKRRICLSVKAFIFN